MRAYVAEDLPADGCRRLADHLRQQGLASGLEGLFWLPVPEQLWTPLQRAHAASCGPYVVALEVAPTSLRLELLVRAQGRLHCQCIGPAAAPVRNALLDLLEALIQSHCLPQ